MKVLRWFLFGLLGLVAVGVGGLYATGNGSLLGLLYAIAFGAPDHPFDPVDAVAPPDYADEANWAALPTREDLADLVPAGVEVDLVQGAAPVDVFFIHPTGFLKGSAWTHSMDPNTATEENTRWMMANQASAYNGCCNVYAPRYRQASIYAYFHDEALRERILEFAYEDVERAFEYFLTHYNQGRPFVVASHSQGTHHGVRLMQRRIEGSPEAQRMVAAYLIGGGVPRTAFDDLEDVHLCDGATDLHCVVHWDTWSETQMDADMEAMTGNVCTNPLTWALDGARAPRAAHLGAVPGSGEFHLALTGDDAARGVEFRPLGEPMPALLEAECRDGILYVTDQSHTRFGRAPTMGPGNYHGLDYPLFHMDIRRNAQQRVAAYLRQMQATRPIDAGP